MLEGPEVFRRPHPYKRLGYRIRKWSIRTLSVVGLIAVGVAAGRYYDGLGAHRLGADAMAHELRRTDSHNEREILFRGGMMPSYRMVDVIAGYARETENARTRELADRVLMDFAEYTRELAGTIPAAGVEGQPAGK